LSSPLNGFWTLVSKTWTDLNFVLLLNMLLVGCAYLVLLMLTNRLWIASPALLAVVTVIAVIEHFKVELRYEAIQPSDLDFLGSNTGNLVSFVPDGAALVIVLALLAFFLVVAAFVLIGRLDARHGRLVRGPTKAFAAVIRLLLILAPCLFLGLYGSQAGTYGSWARSFSSAMGDIPSMWDSVYDAQRNGVAVAFLRQLNPTIMEEPEGYSKATMKAVAKRYASEASTINSTRSQNLKDSTVVFVLSESFSDPSRVPGLSLNKDAMPKIRQIKSETTSGLMLSSGYGGGTANLEYMGLTGLSMVNFDSSLTSPYQQLVPGESWTPTFNRLWGSTSNSVAFHPYESSMYSRSTNYVKFGFSRFYTLQSPRIAYQKKIDDSPYVSDESTYDSALKEISGTSSNQFVQIITMQNHMPYRDWYDDNDFTATSTDSSKQLGDSETESIETYAKGVNLTDDATKKFLDKLDKLDKPVTVVFYGDHLPGIYSTASADTGNALALHLTDYFIWSNKASASSGTKDEDASYSSPNFFMAQAAEHMDAKVSPYLAFLTELHTKVSAMEPPLVNKIQGWDRIPAGQAVYLDSSGNPMSAKDFDSTTKRLLRDYRLIQYDITAGKGYLKDLGFMTVK
ncbi:LTA synthase family protein, partial [uncultured Bifidobacterium sp.]|uniref:LTA synthase family protein n=1 Tax=uncultured Bifidobacterium sp. TaxID=165187 RepID=UPI0028DB70D1